MKMPVRSVQLPLPASVREIAAAIAFASLVVGCSSDPSRVVGPASIGDPSGGSTTGPASAASAGNPMNGAIFWVSSSSPARRTADSWRASRPADASQLDKIAAQPHVFWLGSWNREVRADVDAVMRTMSEGGALPVLVAYNIPQRDCGGLSGNTGTTPSAYRAWIAEFAAGIGSRRATVILEPDALAGIDCLTAADQSQRLALLSYAVETLRASGSVSVYLDGGNPGWRTAATMASRLARSGIALAQGFALNVSNFIGTSENVAYGSELSSLVGGKHFIIDTGRNGTGAAPDKQWCNPAGRALGPTPTARTNIALVDAFLWVKAPGISDGACGGAAAVGEWMPEYALGLAQRAAY